MVWSAPVAFVNARVVTEEGVADSLRAGVHILSIGERPARRDVVIDLEGAWVLPGLVNAHDHLELNHYGRLKFRDHYANASEWIDDMRPRLAADTAIREGRAHSLAARLFIGALKNLLAGTTTVAHHNPLYRELRWRFPIRVVRRYGWAHSFCLERQPVGARGEPGGDVAGQFRATPANAPFVVHLGEGVDDNARIELLRFEALGCLAPNTVLVHGVAMDGDTWQRVARSGTGLVWCPASNEFLFHQTAPVGEWLGRPADAPMRIALGTDSRLTGSRDLLDELRAAAAVTKASPSQLLRMVTTAPSRLLRIGAGRLATGSPADLIVVPPKKNEAAETLLETSRHDIALVMIGGQPLVASAACAAVFRARRVTPRPIVVDGTGRLADSHLAHAIERCPIQEPGVACA